jgi:hypothetical protein
MNSGELTGSVEDRSGGALAGATVVAEHMATGQKFSAIANSAGEYLLPQLPVGVDLSLPKDIRVTEAAKLQFRAEAYNLFNHPNFNIPNCAAFTANFGSISSAQDSRQLQFALKLLF